MPTAHIPLLAGTESTSLHSLIFRVMNANATLHPNKATAIRCCLCCRCWPWHWNESENCKVLFCAPLPNPPQAHLLTFAETANCKIKRGENRLNHMWNLNTQIFFILHSSIAFASFSFSEKKDVKSSSSCYVASSFCERNLRCTVDARYVMQNVHEFIYTLDTCCRSHCAIKSICTITMHIACQFASIKTTHI